MKKMFNLKRLMLVACSVAAIGAIMNGCSDPAQDAAKPSNQISAKPVVPIGGDSECDVTEINVDTEFISTNIYLLKGDVRVTDGAELTIQPGTVIYGDKGTKGTLTIERGSKIFANGSPSAPIVFTSSALPGNRRPQDWGGINIFGDAPNNLGSNLTPEGFPVCTQPWPTHGGENCADNSGVFKYVRIEYAGIPIVEGNEKNALTMYSVGSGTELHHVQVSYGGDDGFEWFGGCVNASYLISMGMQDDDFDSDNGFSGAVAYGVGIKHPTHLDNSGSNAFESDNNASGSNASPRTSACFTNFTLLGPYSTLCDRTVSNATSGFFHLDGLHLRRNTGIGVYNSLIVGFRRNQAYGHTDLNSGAAHADFNTAVHPDVTLHTQSPTGTNCYVLNGSDDYWTDGLNDICNGPDTECGDEFTPGSLAELSGLTTAAWPAVVEVGTSGYFEFADFNFSLAFVPYDGAAILTNGGDTYDATKVACSDVYETLGFVRNRTTASGGADTFFRGAFRAADDNGWGATSGWIESNPQAQNYAD